MRRNEFIFLHQNHIPIYFHINTSMIAKILNVKGVKLFLRGEHLAK